MAEARDSVRFGERRLMEREIARMAVRSRGPIGSCSWTMLASVLVDMQEMEYRLVRSDLSE